MGENFHLDERCLLPPVVTFHPVKDVVDSTAMAARNVDVKNEVMRA